MGYLVWGMEYGRLELVFGRRGMGYGGGVRETGDERG